MEYLAAVLGREVAARDASGVSYRSAPPGSAQPRRWKTSSSTTNPRSNATPIAHPATGTFLAEAENMVLGKPSRASDVTK